MTRFTPQWLQAGSYSGAQDRRLIGALWPTPSSVGMAVTVASAMTLNIAAGQVAIPSPNNTGSTLCTSDATEQVVIGAAPASPNNRIDLIVATARGADLDGGANNDWIFQVIAGTVAASPAVPAVPAGSVAIAQVFVGFGVAAIVAGNITDRRPSGLDVRSAQLASAPLGMIADSVLVSSSAPVAGAETTIPGIGITWTALPNRWYEVWCFAKVQPTAANDQLTLRLKRDTTLLAIGSMTGTTAGRNYPVTLLSGDQTPPGSHSIVLTMQLNNGTSGVVAGGSEMMVKDVGGF